MKVKFTLSIGFVGAKHESIQDFGDEFDGMTEQEIDKELAEHWQDWIWNYIDGSHEVIPEISKHGGSDE